jgi:hypothetical protein
MRYYTLHCPENGPLLQRDADATLGILVSPHGMYAIGTAVGLGADTAGVARWRLRINGAELPGEWIVIDQEFRPAQ